MKRTHCPKGEVVFIGGRRVRWSQSKRGGLNFYTDDDCPVVVGEASEVVDLREAEERRIDAGLPKKMRIGTLSELKSLLGQNP